MPRSKGDRGPNQIRKLAQDGGFTEEQVIRAALEQASGIVQHAARALGLERTALWYHLWRLNLGHVPREIRARVRRKFLDD